MVGSEDLFTKARNKILRDGGASYFQKNFIFPGVSNDKPSKARGSSDGSSGSSQHNLRSSGNKQKANARKNDEPVGGRHYALSLQGRGLSRTVANEFRRILSGDTRVREVDWEKLDKDPELQASLYDFLGRGILKITNIPKIPCQYEPSDKLYLGLDTEDNSNGIPHFYQIATRDCVYICSSFRALFRYVIQEYKLNYRNHVVFGTNIEYELGNILKDFDASPETMDIKWRRGRLTKFALSYDPELAYWGRDDDRKGKMVFWDTMNHWPMSVTKMGESLKEHLGTDLTKLDRDFYGFKYAAMDAIISRSYACIQRAYYEKKGIKLKATPGSTALCVYDQGVGKTKFRSERIRQTHTPEDIEWIMEGLRGGRTEVFSTRKHYGNVEYLDINSAYPFSMKHGVFPNLMQHFWIEGDKEIRECIDADYEGMVECDVEAINLHPFTMIYPYLGYKDNDTQRFFFPLGKWKSKYTFFEIRNAEKLGYKFKFRKAIVYERCKKHPFQKYVDFCYAIRMEGDATKNKLLKDVGKSLGNNLYGKWGERQIFSTLVDPGKYNADDLISCARIGTGVVMEEDEGYASHTNGIWGAYITAICRDLLYQHMVSAWNEGNVILYVDTDGIFITGGKLPKNDPVKLGALKHEGTLYYFRAYLPKQYEYQYLDEATGFGRVNPKTGKTETVYKAKGIPEFYDIVNEKGEAILDANGVPKKGNLREKFFATGEADFRKPLKVREAIRRKKFKDPNINPGIDAINAWISVKKELRGHLTKRTVLKNGWTLPLWISMKQPDWYSPPEMFCKD